MCYPIQEIKHRNIDYFIFSRAVILHSLQVKFVCLPSDQKPTANPVKRIAVGKEEQRHERALTLKEKPEQARTLSMWAIKGLYHICLQ